MGTAETTGAGDESGTSSETDEGDSESSSGEETGMDELPSAATPEAIAEFLAREGHLGATWRAETPEPRERSSSVSPHDRVQVHFNDILIQSQAAGNGTLDGSPHDKHSMAVKRMFDIDGEQVGTAVMFKHEAGESAGSWAYYCVGPADRCLPREGPFDEEEPVFGMGLQVDCGVCHGGLVFTEFDAVMSGH